MVERLSYEVGSLARGEVVVHRVALDVGDDERMRLETLLSGDERRRAECYRFAADRDRFLVSRARLRLLLSGYGAGPAAVIRFGSGASGKPMLPAQPDLRFNLSHAGDRALVAVGWRREVGVDLERLRGELAFAGVARRFFSRAENTILARRHGRERVTAFYRCWCRKEAYVKARGDGLLLPLSSFDVAVGRAGAGAASLLLATRPDAREAAAWDLRDLDGGDGYVAALAAERRIGRVRYVDHPDGVDLESWSRALAIRSM